MKRVYAEHENKENLNGIFENNKELLSLLEESKAYYILEDFNKADSVFKKALQLAESTQNKEIILETYFFNTSFEISENTTLIKKEDFISYILQGIEYAKMYNRPEYVAYGNASISEVYRKKGEINNALKYANLAFSTALNLKDDSCKVITALQLGKIYQEQKEMLLAFKTFTNAHDIAQRAANESLISTVYHSLASLYQSIGKSQEAKSYYFKSLQLNKNNKNYNGMIADYIAIGASYDYNDGISYLNKALALAKKEKNLSLQKKAQIYIFSYLIINGNSKESLKYLNENSIIQTYYKNRGPFNNNWTIGEIYLYADELDSAKKYFDEAQSYYLSNDSYDNNAKLNFLAEYSMLYNQLKDKKKALELYHQAFDLSVLTNDINQKIDFSNKIKKLSAENGDYQTALMYAELADHYKDTLNLIMKEKEFSSLEIENENKRIEAEKLKIELEEKRIHNLQYMGITVFICLVFTILLFMSGRKKYSLRLIEIIGFFAFIFLFEFIILVLDAKIHHLTHGSPLKIWLIKIVVISFLLPFHHYIEEVVIEYLKKKKMLEDKKKFSFKSIFQFLKPEHSHLSSEEVKESSNSSTPIT
ncbi:MAG: tetratricopeptide repeat protein [Chitinophagales bacterium]|nr:tetratricopeptide repeat protein [Chitinophagales bacterium]MCZ2394047.1 tetratricopeptide repeat protein [Chitinophagales bacterium]